MTDATKQSVTVIGACHVDSTMSFDADPQMGRTNPARVRRSPGGVAANIARHLAMSGHRVTFLGVAAAEDRDRMEAQLTADSITAHLVPMEGETPSYTAAVGPDGSLILGAADMALYEDVTEEKLRPLPNTGALVLDANFPAHVLHGVASRLPDQCRLFAAATSIYKIERLVPLLPRLDAIVMNRAEAERLTSKGPVTDMALRIANLMRPEACALISDGIAEAALARNGQGVVTALPPQGDLVNANGAGDAMAAALFSQLFGRSADGLSDMLFDKRATAMLEVALAAGAAFACDPGRR